MRQPMVSPCARLLFVLLGLLGLSGCGGLVDRFATNLSSAMMDNNDPATVEAGAASYLLLLDALVLQKPDNAAFRQAAASLNSAYAGVFVKDGARAAVMTDKALTYALEALCLEHEDLCDARKLALDEFRHRLAGLDADDVPLIYTTGSVWAGWIQAHSEDWNAVADMPRIEALMQRVVALDEAYQHGAAHLYLGGLATVLPPALGGRPEVGKTHFERAIALSEGHNLMAKVLYAKNYARGIFDRDLHDRLLNEVVAADPQYKGWTLSNVMARKEAEALLKSADEYF
jgi:hypothetical protein